jgi:hypothetical protein
MAERVAAAAAVAAIVAPLKRSRRLFIEVMMELSWWFPRADGFREREM